MKSNHLRIALAMTLLFANLLIMISCGDSGRRENAETVASAAPPPPPKACKSTSTTNQQKINDLNEDLAQLDALDADISGQLIGRPTPRPDPSPDTGPQNFSIDFEEYDSSAGGAKQIVMRIKGKITGDEDGPPHGKATKFTKLLKFLDKNMTRGCIDAVSFEPSVTGARTAERGFEWWSACEYPNTACGDGSCRRDCTGHPLLPTQGTSPTPAPTGSATPSPSPTGP